MVSAVHAADRAEAPSTSAVVKKMEGVLWYNMLSDMQRDGLDASTLGVGSDTYQGMFLWDIAQNDFGKYDSALVSATLRQIGGRASPPPARETIAPPDAASAAEGGAASGTAVSNAVLLAHAADLTRRIWPSVQMAAAVLGVSPVGVLAQAALETGWGSSLPGNNLFGIKAGAGSPATSRSTHEMVDGALVSTTASFRDYGSPQACVADYIRLIQTNFRGVVGQNTVAGFAGALQAGGFATDSGYANKIIAISRSSVMTQILQSLGSGVGGGSLSDGESAE